MPTSSGGAGYLFLSLGVCILAGHWLKIKKPRVVQEAGAVIMLGALMGWLDSSRKGLLMFDEALFFEWLLPPIIFTAGFCNRHKHFFDNLTVILVFGLVGTVMNFLAIAYMMRSVTHLCDTTLHDIEILSLASILSATDSVAVLGVLSSNDYPNLFGVLSGEGILNDAIALVLFGAVGSTAKRFNKTAGVSGLPAVDYEAIWELVKMFAAVSLSSVAVGIAFGALASILFRYLMVNEVQMEPKREIALLIVAAYSANYVSTLLDVSGILSLFVCGVMMSHYTAYSLTLASRESATHAFETLSYACETFLFFSLGYYAVNYPEATWCLQFLVAVIAILVVSRGVTVAFLVAALQLWGIDIGWKQGIVLWWAGMIRGALAFALSFDVVSKKSRSLIISTTYGVVMVTTFFFGGTASGLLELLDMPVDETEASTETFWASHHFSLAKWFHGFDDKYVKRILGGKQRGAGGSYSLRSAPIPETLPLMSPDAPDRPAYRSIR